MAAEPWDAPGRPRSLRAAVKRGLVHGLAGPKDALIPFPQPQGTGTADMSHRHQPLEQLSGMSNLQLESWKGEKIMIDAS